MRIAVTGSGGLLGTAATAELGAAGHDLRTLDRTGGDGAAPVDLRDPQATSAALAGCDAIAHLAALPTPDAAPAQIVWAENVAMIANVLFAAARLGIRRIVYASSQSALGLPYATGVIEPEYLPVDEDHPCRPADAYSLSKLVGEELAGMFCRQGALDVRCLRFPVIWRAEHHSACIRRRLEVPEQGARSLWAYVDARDAARAVRLALERPWSGLEVLNVAAARAFAPEPIPDLLRRFLPGVTDIRVSLERDTAMYDWRKAQALLGFRARYRWGMDGIADEGPKAS